MSDPIDNDPKSTAAILEYTHGDASVVAESNYDQSALETKPARAPIVPFTIYIDRLPYLIAQCWVSGADIRKFSHPPIGLEKDIFLEIAGQGSAGDFKMSDSDGIELNPQMGPQKFYSQTKAEEIRAKAGSSEHPTRAEIAERAYQLYVMDGFQIGRDLEHWITAESQLKAEYGTFENAGMDSAS